MRPHRQDATRAALRRRLAVAGLVCLLAAPAQAQSSRLPPVMEALTAPLSDGELAGLGCLASVTASSAAVVALSGGLGAITAALSGPLPPVDVLQGGAALAFLVSSACYVGQALAPAAMMGWESLTDWFAPPTPPPDAPGTAPSAALSSNP